LSSDFYQVFAGKVDMTLFGWKQLALWSIDHSCLEPEKMQEVRTEWNKLWYNFCHEIIRGYGREEEVISRLGM
jgi:adenosine deaminase CECR1